MASIDVYIRLIEDAIYGEEIRSAIRDALTAINGEVETTRGLVGTPEVATLAEEMVDTDKIYVYAGEETGYVHGSWYYYDGEAWVVGGDFNHIEALSQFIEASDTEPSSAYNEIWIDTSSTQEVEVPTMEEFNDLKEDLNDNLGNEAISLNYKHYIATNVSVGTVIDYTATSTSSGNLSCAVVDCDEGDNFTFYGDGGSTGRLWCFIDSENKAISNAPSNKSADGLVVTAPENAAKCIVNIDGTAFIGKSVDVRLSDLEELQSNYLQKRTELTSSDDLNDVKTIGIYAWASASVPNNAPYSVAGTMIVLPFNNASTNGRKTQIITASDYMYYRIQASTGWQDWIKLANKTEVDTEVNAIKERAYIVDKNTFSSWIDSIINASGELIETGRGKVSDYYVLKSYQKYAYINAPFIDDEDMEISLYICTYTANNTFLGRYFLSGANPNLTQVAFGNDVKKIRFCMCYTTAQAKAMTNGILSKFYCYITKAPLVEATQLRRITFAVPENEGQLNVVRRCRQFTDIKWTPLFDIPRLSLMSTGEQDYTSDDQLFEDVFKAGVEYTGIPYARAMNHASNWGRSAEGMKVGFAADFSTFISCIRNPDSVVAQESTFSKSAHNASFYASVCASMCSYAYGLSSYKATSQLPSVSGMTLVGTVSTREANEFKLGDFLSSVTLNHSAIITDIISDNSGNALYIEVSEATDAGNDNWDYSKNSVGGGGPVGGLCRRKAWSISDFMDYWGDFNLMRYSYIANVPYTKSPYVNTGDELDLDAPLNFPVMPYMGENFVYKSGYIYNTKILVSASGFDYMRVKKDGVAWNSNGTTDYYAVSGDSIDVGFTATGDYEAYLCNLSNGSETTRTISCHWKVVS